MSNNQQTQTVVYLRMSDQKFTKMAIQTNHIAKNANILKFVLQSNCLHRKHEHQQNLFIYKYIFTKLENTSFA